jgi:hypothetical protein
MSDKKISALTASTVPLAGTEVLPIVQGGATKKVAVSDLTDGRSVNVLSLTSTNDSTISSVTVGKGGGAVVSNTTVGAAALAANSTGAQSTAVGYTALRFTTVDNNSAFGYQAGYTNDTGKNNSFFGNLAGYNSTGGGNALFGESCGYSLSTGKGNSFFGTSVFGEYVASGYYVTTGSYNTIVGNYSGNNAVLDIRTANNYAVVSDGAGAIKAYGDPSQNWNIPSGNLVIGTSGKGIDFSVDGQAAGMTSELLDDYEEGTFTATLTPAVGAFSAPITATATYTKVGRAVYIALSLVTVSDKTVGTASGALTITGLPFTSAINSGAAIGYVLGWATDIQPNLTAYVGGAGTTITLYKQAATATSFAGVDVTDMVFGGTRNYISLSATYSV